MKTYYLLNKDIPLLIFNEKFEIVEILNTDNLPYALHEVITATFYDNDEINQYFSKYINDRINISIVRPDIDNVLTHIFGEYYYKNLSMLLDKIHFLSITDTFWICKCGSYSPQMYNNINPYDAEIDETIVDIFIGEADVEDIMKTNFAISPEFTLGGSQYKYIIKHKDDLYIHKYDYDLSTTLVSKIALNIFEAFNIPVYEISIYDYFIETDVFTNKEVSFLPASALFNSQYTFFDIVEDERIEHIRDSVEKFLILNYLILNTDLHLNNWGFLVDSMSQKIISVAPAFDLDMILWFNFDYDELSCKDATSDYILEDHHNEEVTNIYKYIEMDVLSKYEKSIEDLLYTIDNEDAFLREIYDYIDDTRLKNDFYDIVQENQVLFYERCTNILQQIKEFNNRYNPKPTDGYNSISF